MSNLVLDNHIIKKDIKAILSAARNKITNGKLASINFKGDEVSVTCPFHKEGKESKPSCGIYVGDDSKLPWGTFNCFTCGEKGSLVSFLAGVFETSEYVAKEWLKSNFTESVTDTAEVEIDGAISFDARSNPRDKNTFMDEGILETFQSWHPYIEERHISKDIAKEFEIKYDPETRTIVFPVRDERGRLIFLTRRSVEGKRFYIDSNATKCIYLLDEAIKNNYDQLIVVESQINALVSYSYGFPAVALFGAGTTDDQLKILNRTNIMHYILMYDNDEAGRKGAYKFKSGIKKSVFVTDIVMPKGKDVADCSKEEFLNILKNNNIKWR